MFPRATERIHKLIVILGVSITADPTKLVLAVKAGHVVASIFFLDQSLAYSAFSNNYLLGQLDELLTIFITAPSKKSTMIFLAALGAYLLTALTPQSCRRPRTFASIKPFAILFGATANIRIRIQNLHQLKRQVLNVQLVMLPGERSIQQIFDVAIPILLVTLIVAALQIEYLAIFYQLFDVLSYAQFAEFVTARHEYVELRIWFIIKADPAIHFLILIMNDN